VTTRYDPWGDAWVRQVADVLGHTNTGLTGPQIGRLLAEIGVADPLPTASKRDRLALALQQHQARERAANCVIAFVTRAMAPVTYRETPGLFTLRQDALNEVLVFAGLRVNDEGKVARGARATTLSEAAQHASSIRSELRRRGTHQAVLDYCTVEILARNAFHASLEATKGVAERLRG
jgi:hypothetical protein